MEQPTPNSTKIALSDRWTAANRVVNLIGIPALLGVAGFVAIVTWNSSVAIGSHTEDLANIKISVASIDTRGQADHDKLTAFAVDFGNLKDRVDRLGAAVGRVLTDLAGRGGPVPPPAPAP